MTQQVTMDWFDERGGPRIVKAHGLALTCVEWADRLGYSHSAMRYRLATMDSDEACLPPHASELWPGANELPWEADPIAQALVARNGPMLLDEVAVCLGVSRERVRQIEAEALHKIQLFDARHDLSHLRNLHEGLAEERTRAKAWAEAG